MKQDPTPSVEANNLRTAGDDAAVCNELLVIAKKITDLKALRSDVIQFRREIDREIEGEEKRRDGIKLNHRNNRLRTALSMRREGKSFVEIGNAIRVTASRARSMCDYAQRLESHKRL